MKNLFCIFILALLVSCSASEESTYRKVSGTTWGTFYNITYKHDSDLTDSLETAMHVVDMSLSPFADGSIVSRLNSGEDVMADSMFRDVFSLSCHVCSISGGMFDPTVAPIVNLWGFGYRNGMEDVPSDSAICTALDAVGILCCSITPDGRVVKKSPSTEFNFSAVAKGYGVDCVAEQLRRLGCTDFMVEIGGEIAVSGKSPRGTDWVIQVDAPVDDRAGTTHSPIAYISLTDKAVATSGNYRNYRETAQGRVAHTVSPVTGRPVQTNTLSATVVAPTCALADALATACMTMEVADALRMVEAEGGAECMLVSSAERGELTVTMTEGFEKLRKK